MQTYGFDYAFAVSWAKINAALAKNLAGSAIDLSYYGAAAERRQPHLCCNEKDA
jgi:hypothetical protein